MPWKGGVIVANAPDLSTCRTRRRQQGREAKVLYTGFGLEQHSADPQLVPLGHRQLGLRGERLRGRHDHLPRQAGHEAAGAAWPGDSLQARRARQHRANLRRRAVRPDLRRGRPLVRQHEQPHLRQIVLPEHYLRRNPYFAAPATTVDIPDHGAACKVFRISPFEAWRVERTTRRKDGPDAKRLPATELVPGGYITSACSPCYYGINEPLFPEKDRGCVYVCDPGEQPDHARQAGAERLDLQGQAHRQRRASSSPRPTTGSAPYT